VKTMQKAIRSLVAVVVISGLVTGPWVPRVALSQPATTPVSSTTTPPPVPGEDEALYSCKKRTGQVAVTFKPETELKDLITWVMGFTCKNFILDPRIVSTGKKVTVIAPNKMSTTEAYRVFLVALSTMGLTIVPKGNVLRIVESATAKSETVPIYKRGIPADEDQVVRYVLRPSYMQPETLRQALDSIRSPAGSVQIAGTMLIITDYASQVRDMMSLARSVDVPGGSDGIYTIPVHHADAAQLAQKLNDILGISAAAAAASVPGGGRRQMVPPQQPGMPPQPQAQVSDDVGSAVPSKILVDDRSNTLIVVSSEAGYLRVKALVDRLDIALDTESGQAIHVYPLENALAEELATTLNNAMGQASARPGQPGQPGRPGQPPVPGAPPMPAPQPMPPSGIDNLGAALEGQVRVIGDKPTNSLIVMSSGRDFIAIKDVVRRLDQPRRQVFIEALILEVQLAKELDIGTSSHGGAPIGSGDTSALVLGGVQTPNLRSIAAASSLATATGLIGGLIGAPLTNSQTILGTSIPSFGVLFQALATQDNTDILSAPAIIAIDNEKTEFSVGNNIPYKAGLSFGGFGLPGAGGAASPTGSIGQNIQRQDLNLSLNVTPHISSQDVVRLEIEQETKDIGGKDAELGPTWTQRKLKTQVVIHDQQSVVIGGLIQERDIYSVTKVPLLGDIPLLGYLFKYSTKAKKKTNLLILLTPYIVKDQLDLQSIRERKIRERQEFVESFSALNEMKYQPKVDYRRKRGLIEEINRSLKSVEDDVNAANALGRRRWVDPGPIEYGPSQIEAPEDGHGDGTTAPQPPPRRIDVKRPEPKPAAPRPATPRPAAPRSEVQPPPAAPKADDSSNAAPPAAPPPAAPKSSAKPGKGKSSKPQLASNPADRAAEGLPATPASRKRGKAAPAQPDAREPKQEARKLPTPSRKSLPPRRPHPLRNTAPVLAEKGTP
jgi:general secretion pathway protein D